MVKRAVIHVQCIIYAPTKMDFVPGVKQKPPLNEVPQVESWWQLPPQPFLSQKPTLVVADRQEVPEASMHVGWPLYTWQSPPQTLSTRLVQYVTVEVPT